MKYDLTIATEKMHNEAAEQGLRIIGKGKNQTYRLYLLSCGHEQEIKLCHVRTGRFKCRSCHPKNDFEQEAAVAGLEIVGESPNTGNRVYRFINCGHVQEIQLHHVRSGKFECRGCIREKHEQEAAVAGLEIVGESPNTDKRVYRCIGCGHCREFEVVRVRSGAVKCPACASSAYSNGFDPTKAGSCYLFRWEHPETGHQFLKFGITNRKVETRITEQQAKTAYKPFQIVNVAYPSGHVAKELERDLDGLQKATGGPYMGRGVFGRGHTETMSMEHEQAIKDLISEYCFGLVGLV
ncbi:MAG: hypothetical protein ACRC2N_02120 [Aeromonas sp.]